MHAIEFLRSSSKGESKPIYAVFGDDPYLRSEVLKAIARLALGAEPDDLAITRFSGDQASLADVFDELRTLPFLSNRRVVVVDEADGFVSAHRSELEAYAGRPSESGVLVLMVKSWPSTTKLAKQVTKVGLGLDVKSPNERGLPSWLMDLASQRFATPMEESAARLLVELVGAELALLASEVEKLATYVGDGKTIQRKDVARMVGAGRVESIWKTLEAATTGQARQALDDLDRLLASGEHPVGLLAAMSASLRKVHYAGQLRMAHVGIEEACREAGIPAYPAAIQNTVNQHRHLGPARVAALPDLLLRADLDLKGSSTLSPRAVLERLLVHLARPRTETPK